MAINITLNTIAIAFMDVYICNSKNTIDNAKYTIAGLHNAISYLIILYYKYKKNKNNINMYSKYIYIYDRSGQSLYRDRAIQ